MNSSIPTARRERRRSLGSVARSALAGAGLLPLLWSAAAFATIDNTVTATGSFGGAPVTATADEQLTVAPEAAVLTVAKSGVLNDGGDGRADAGDTITYTVTVRNDGNVTLKNVAASDPLLTLTDATLQGDAAPLGDSSDAAGGAWDTLSPGDTLSYTGSYVLQPADITAGAVNNTATATGTTVPGTPVTGTGTATTVLNAAPAMTLDKVASFNPGSDGVANAGDVITYTFTVTNTGNVPLTDVKINDPMLQLAEASSAGMDQVLALMDDASLQADPIATASIAPVPPAKPPLYIGPQSILFVPGKSQQVTGQHAVLPPELPVAIHASRKIVNLTGAPDQAGLGDLVGIYVELINAGEVPVTGISVDQQGAEAFGNALDVLAPNTKNAASVIFTHEVTEADLEAGELRLPATLKARARGREVALNLTEPMPLTGLTARDELLTASIDPVSVATLAPGAQTTFTATYPVTQDDIDAGHVANTATAVGTAPGNLTVDATDGTDTPLAAAPAIALVKGSQLDLGSDNVASVGDTITYGFAVTNTGNVTLKNVTITDPLVTVVGGPLVELAPGATDDTTFTATYALTQADIDAGKVENQATASGTPPAGGAPVTDLSDESDPAGNDPTVTTIDGIPKITLLKQFDRVEDVNGNGMTDAGDELRYKFIVENTGNVSLANVTVIDRNVDAIVSPAAPTGVTLAAGAKDETTFTAVYVLKQADIDNGYFENTADVEGEVVGGAKTTDESHPTDGNGNGPTRHDIEKKPALALLKRVASVTDTNSNGVTDISDIINYAFTVTNTGNVTLLNVAVTDPNATIVGGPIASLAPGVIDTTTFNATHTVTADDMVAGSVVNQATVTGRTATGEEATDLSDPESNDENDPTVTPIVVKPAIALVKKMKEVVTNTQGTIDPSDDTIQVSYTFAVTNTGNVRLNNITVTDPLVTVAGSLTSLDPGETDDTSFTATYTVTAADIAAGQVVNQATASGEGPNNAVVTDLSDDDKTTENDPTITPLANKPGIALVKSFGGYVDANNNGVADVGEGVRFVFTVSNTGNVALSNVTITDPNATVSGGPLSSLAVGASDATTFTAVHTLTQADIDLGQVQNQATVTAGSPAGSVTDLSDPTSETADNPTIVVLDQKPSIALIKTVSSVTDANGDGQTNAGDTINYAFTVTNTGNVTLNNVTVTDINAKVDGGPLATLAVGATDSVTFTGRHLVTAADEDEGKVVNQAQAKGATDAGVSVADVSDESDVTGSDPTVTPVSKPKTPVLSKTAARSEVRRGEQVAFTITASNLGAGPYDVADLMPSGFSYVGGSATVNGVAATPAISGSTLSFANITPVAGKITVKLSLLASTTLSNGEFTNRARLYLNATGAQLAEAKAKVKIKEEHLFDCGEIIGKVFDDLNCNGYPDEGEPGLPAVRLATVKGLLITTDKHGRYHLSCADVPNAAIGSNFLMKLDTRTLPDGYRVSSENPRDVRLTRGKLTKLNFGACKRRDLDLDLTKDAFVNNGLELKSKWLAGIDRLIALLKQGRGDLTITYRCGVHAPIADARVEQVADVIQARWQETGAKKPLTIKTRVECGK